MDIDNLLEELDLNSPGKNRAAAAVQVILCRLLYTLCSPCPSYALELDMAHNAVVFVNPKP
jgi:hypothetical protein